MYVWTCKCNIYYYIYLLFCYKIHKSKLPIYDSWYINQCFSSSKENTNIIDNTIPIVNIVNQIKNVPDLQTSKTLNWLRFQLQHMLVGRTFNDIIHKFTVWVNVERPKTNKKKCRRMILQSIAGKSHFCFLLTSGIFTL